MGSEFELVHKRTPEQLKVGDHIYSFRSISLYPHHGIVVEVPPVGTKDPELSHRIKVAQVSRNPPMISEVDLNEFRQGRQIRIVKYGESAFCHWVKFNGTCNTRESDPPEIVVKRARKQLEDMDKIEFDLLSCNSEHWATFCKTGFFESGQVIGLGDKVCSVGQLAGKKVYPTAASYLGKVALPHHKKYALTQLTELVKKELQNAAQGPVTGVFSFSSTKIIRASDASLAKKQLDTIVGKFLLTSISIGGIQLVLEFALFVFRVGMHLHDDTFNFQDAIHDTKKSLVVGASSVAVAIAASLLFGGGIFVLILASVIGTFVGPFFAEYIREPDIIDRSLSFLRLSRNSTDEEIHEKRRKLMKLIAEVHPDSNVNDKADTKQMIRYYFLQTIREALDDFIEERAKGKTEATVNEKPQEQLQLELDSCREVWEALNKSRDEKLSSVDEDFYDVWEKFMPSILNPEEYEFNKPDLPTDKSYFRIKNGTQQKEEEEEFLSLYNKFYLERNGNKSVHPQSFTSMSMITQL